MRDLFLIDGTFHLRLLRIYKRRGACDFHRLCDLAHFHRKVSHQLLTDDQLHGFPLFNTEPRMLNSNGVYAALKSRQAVVPYAVRHRGAGDACLIVTNRYCHVRQRSTGLIDHGTLDDRAALLCRRSEWQDHKEKRQTQDLQKPARHSISLFVLDMWITTARRRRATRGGFIHRNAANDRHRDRKILQFFWRRFAGVC